MAGVRRQGLAQTLAELRDRISQMTQRKGIGESNTKAVLIEPLLSRLGWDLEDIDEVSREYKRKRQDNPVDYALMVRREPCLFVEAKALRVDLSDRKWLSQTLGYATVVGVEWCVLTNGDEYRIYNAHAPVDIEEKLFRSVKISDDGQSRYTEQTLALLSKAEMGKRLIDEMWRRYFIDKRVKTAFEGVIQDEDRRIASLVRSRATDLKPKEILDSLGRAEIRIDFLEEPSNDDNGNGGPPKPTRSKGKGQEHPIDLIQGGMLSAPVEIEGIFRGTHLQATIEEDGQVVFDGETHKSLSAAAVAAKQSVSGKRHASNGWNFWWCHDPKTGKLVKLLDLRERYREGK